MRCASRPEGAVEGDCGAGGVGVVVWCGGCALAGEGGRGGAAMALWAGGVGELLKSCGCPPTLGEKCGAREGLCWLVGTGDAYGYGCSVVGEGPI